MKSFEMHMVVKLSALCVLKDKIQVQIKVLMTLDWILLSETEE